MEWWEIGAGTLILTFIIAFGVIIYASARPQANQRMLEKIASYVMMYGMIVCVILLIIEIL